MQTQYRYIVTASNDIVRAEFLGTLLDDPSWVQLRTGSVSFQWSADRAYVSRAGAQAEIDYFDLLVEGAEV